MCVSIFLLVIDVKYHSNSESDSKFKLEHEPTDKLLNSGTEFKSVYKYHSNFTQEAISSCEPKIETTLECTANGDFKTHITYVINLPSLHKCENKNCKNTDVSKPLCDKCSVVHTATFDEEY